MKTNNSLKFLAVMALSVIVFASCQKEILDDRHVPIPMKNLPILNQGGSLSVNLIAGQSIDAGDVVLSFDETSLYVDFVTTDGWMLNEVHLWVGSSLSDLPKTKAGNPQIGLFPFKESNLNGATIYRMTVPLSYLGGYNAVCNNQFYVAAHAAVYKETSPGVIQTETGWGEGSPITNRGSWAMYFGFQFNCELDNPVAGDCETAYGFGSTTFIQSGLSSKWGWVITIDAEGSYSTPLYAGAGQNNLSNGTHVGNFNYEYVGGVLTASFDMFTGFTMSETHLYAGTSFPTNAAPGQYGNTNNLNAATTDSYTIQLSGGTPIYLIAHAVVCD
jgi:hypothetical protein